MPLGLDTDDQTLGVYQILVFGAIALVVLSTTLLLGLAVVGSVADDLGQTKQPRNKTASPDPVTGQAVSFDDTTHSAAVLAVYQVNDSTGYGIRLTGASDSFVESQESFELAGDDTWSVSTWARVNESAGSKTMTAVSANGRVLLQYNGTDGNWTAWYYDESSTNSYRVNVSAPDQPGNYTLVTVTSNSTHLWMYANTSKGDVKNITASNIADVGVSATNWNGSLDETRTFDDPTNDSQQSTLYSNPVAPRPDRTRTARIMYDEGSGTTTAIYFTSTRADLSNTTWVTGLSGNELTEGTDYTLDQDAGTITALGGGRIDGAPVVWIDYRYQPLNRVGEVAAALSSAFTLFGSSVIVIPAIGVLAVLFGGLLYAVRVAKVVEFDDEFFGRKGGR